MEAPNFAAMFIARFMEGVSASCIWISGLSLICDTAPESKVGSQLGAAMMGLNVGLVIAPPIGGALYNRFGYRGPFVFAILVAFFDLVGRLLVIERKDARKWGHDPGRGLATGVSIELERRQTVQQQREFDKTQMDDVSIDVPQAVTPQAVTQPTTPAEPAEDSPRRPQISTKRALLLMIRSPRIATATWATVVFAITISALEPTLPLRMQEVWNYDSKAVGLVYLAMAVPTVFMTYLSGWTSDKFGAAIITFICFIAASLWYLCLMTRVLWFFIMSLIISNMLLNGVSAPLSAEFASIKRSINEIGYAHVYGAFNIAYGLGTLVGPITAGQIYDQASNGWRSRTCDSLVLSSLE
ncbi:MFS general substrate transporter [Schizopora paradoxa]|uniref:MFS general substrate transporter n=1 Tax=Schizopora paradoxa TaxID=27342 RepID=A0A0H2R1T4_9AGAM|nr:MFS general substrate transporter [Schizopora paradoxa]